VWRLESAENASKAFTPSLRIPTGVGGGETFFTKGMKTEAFHGSVDSKREKGNAKPGRGNNLPEDTLMLEIRKRKGNSHQLPWGGYNLRGIIPFGEKKAEISKSDRRVTKLTHGRTLLGGGRETGDRGKKETGCGIGNLALPLGCIRGEKGANQWGVRRGG